MRIRKQVYELTLADFDKYSIWEFALDEEGLEGQDEATVKPRPDVKIADPKEGMFVVKTEFIVNDGSKFYGYSTPQEEYELGYIQPIIVTNKGQVMFWKGMFKPTKKDIEKDYKILGKNKNNLFPVKFQAIVPAKGVKLEGQITAFLYKPKDKIREIK